MLNTSGLPHSRSGMILEILFRTNHTAQKAWRKFSTSFESRYPWSSVVADVMWVKFEASAYVWIRNVYVNTWCLHVSMSPSISSLSKISVIPTCEWVESIIQRSYLHSTSEGSTVVPVWWAVLNWIVDWSALSGLTDWERNVENAFGFRWYEGFEAVGSQPWLCWAGGNG